MTETKPHHGLLAVLLAAPFLAQADATIANVATPAIRADTGASGAAIELVIGGYLVAYAVLLITGARLGMTHGYKRMFMLGLAVFGLASLAGGLAPSVEVLIAARVAQGAGAALMYPQALTGIQLHFSGGERTRAIGMLALALAAGAVIGQVAGGVLISADVGGALWRPIFLVNVPICLGVAFAAWRLLPRDEDRVEREIDVGGVAILSAAVLLAVVPLTLGRGEGWPAWTWACLAASVPAFLVFLRFQRRASARGGHPLVDTGVVGRPAVSLGLLALATTISTYYALLFTLAQYMQRGLGRDALASGLMLVPWVAAFGLAGQIARRLPERAVRMLPWAGYVLLAFAYCAIALTLSVTSPGDLLLASLLCLGGLGLGTGFAALIGHLTNAVPSGYASDISGVSSTALQIGAALGVAAFGSLYLGLAPEEGARHAFAITTLAMGVVCAFGVLAARQALRGAEG